MFNFDVKDLIDCSSAIAIVKAVMAIDAQASVYVRMATHCVEVTSQAAGAGELLRAIAGAGFAAVLVPEEETATSAWSSQFPRHAPGKIPFEPDGTEFDSGDA